MPAKKTTSLIDGFPTFGKLLRYLRERAHMTQFELAAQVGYHHSYISYLEKDLRLPDESALLARFVPALGVEDEPKLVERLLELASEKNKKSRIPAREMTPIVGETKAYALPISLTSIVGREEASAQLLEMLHRPDVR